MKRYIKSSSVNYLPTNKVIYRKPDELCYGYANSGKKVEMDFWDWTCMEILIQNYIDGGLSRDEALAQFWQDVKAYDPEEFDRVLEYSRWDNFDDCVADGEYNDLCVDYFDSLGFTEAPADEDPNAGVQACDDIEASVKYTADMCSIGASDDTKISVSGLRNILRRFNANGTSAKSGAWEIGAGGYDLWWEISYNGTPVVDCVDGKLERVGTLSTDAYEQLKSIIMEEYPDMV